MFDFIPLQYYSACFYWSVFVICLFVSLYYASSVNQSLLYKQRNSISSWLCVFLLMLYIGLRPICWMFQDMLPYAHTYMGTWGQVQLAPITEEWGLAFIMVVCQKLHLSVNSFFLVIAIGYIFPQMLTCRKLLEENPGLAMLFIISAFSFWGFGTNGIRNGLACSFTMLGIVYIIQKQYIQAFSLFFVASGIHRSVFLPILMVLIATMIAKKPKIAINFWILSIFISLVFGNQVTTFFSELGFDDRMAQYALMKTDSYYKVGFRWDFLLYSAIPILLTWYICEIKKIENRTFNILAITYILSNSFWVMVIRAAFSNRFAYLSWFIYPLVIAYALIRIPIWKDQDRKLSLFLGGYAIFMIGMFLIGKLY